VKPAFNEWIRTSGRSTYTRSLLRFPATTLWEPIAHVRYAIGVRPRVEIGTGTHEHAPVSEVFEAVFLFRNPLAALLLGVIVLAGCIAAYATGKRGAYVVAAAMLALFYPQLWLVWVGDALEVTRHALLANLQLHLGIWLGALWILDAVLTTASRP
jgi:hypothetical protein